MTRFMRFCAFLSVLFFASNVFAAGYTCSTTKTYTSCNANYYLSSGTCTACPSSYPYSAGGTGGISSCYKNATKTGSQLEPATPSGCASKTTSACTPGTCTYKDYYSGTDGTCTPTNCTKTISSVTASANYYVSGTTCKTCSSYSSTYTKSDGGSISSSSCYTNITRGCTQNNGSTPSGCASVTAWNSCSCAGGTYKKYASGSTSGTTSNETCTKTPKTVTASSNYYVSGTTCPSCSSYSSTYTKSDGGSISSSSCYTNITRGCTQNNGSTPSGCASVTAWNSCSCAGGTYKKYASGSTSGTTSNETCTKTPKTVTASANYYVSGTTCPSCSSFSSTYTKSDGGSIGSGSCYVSRTNTGSQNSCSQPSNSVSYSCNTCTPGTCTYKDYYSATDTTCTPSNCTQTVKSATCKANYYGTTSCTACSSFNSSYPYSDQGTTSSNYCYASKTNTGSQLACSQPSNSVSYTCGTCSPGTCSYRDYYNATDTTCTPSNCTKPVASATCKANYYGSTSCTACDSSYPYSDQGTTSSNYCYASKTNTGSQLACSQPSNSVSYTCGTCSPGTCTWRDYKNATDTTCTPSNCTKPVASATCKANYYGSTSCTACDSSYPYSDQGTTSSNYCYASKTNTGSQLACSQPANSSAYTCGTCTPGTCSYRDYKNATDTTCTPSNCTKPVASATCNANYYGTTSCTACPSNSSSAAGSDARADCSCNAGYGGDATTGSCTICAAGSYKSSAGNASCGTCTAGYYCTGGTNRTACPSPTTYAPNSFGAEYYSPSVESASVTSGTGKSAATQCQALYWYTSSRGKFYEYSMYSSSTGRYVASQIGGWHAVNAGYYLTTKAGCGAYAYYSEVKQCPAGSYCPGKTSVVCNSSNQATVHTTNFGLNTCPSGYDTSAAGSDAASDCYISVAAGKYVGTANSATLSTCAGGTYKAAHSVAYGSTSSCATCSAGYYCPEGASGQTACGGNTKFSSSGASSCSTVSSGYYSTGGTSTTRTGQTKCEAGNYCSGGVKTACGGGKYSAAGATSCTNITAGCYGTSASSACPAVCAANTYSNAGASSCSSCPTDYKNSGTTAASHAGSASCIITVSGGYYIGTAGDNSGNWDKCAGGTYKASHTVAYGGTSSCSTCSAGYYCPEGASSQTACGGNNKYSSSGASACSTVSSGYYTTGGGSTTRTGQTKCEAGNYCSGGVKTACGGGKYSAAGATSCSNITAGCYGTSASSACPAVCAANTYSNAGASSCSSCPTDYKNSGTTAASHAGSASCIITVSGGYYIGTAGDNSGNWDKCAGGTYKASHTVAYGGTSSCAACGGGKYSAAGSTSCSNISEGCYGTSASSACPAECAAGTYAPAGSASCSACTGRTKYSAKKAGSCSTVSGGYYTTGCNTSGNNCTGQSQCTSGTYCASGVSNNCPSGYGASAAGSDAAADCYMSVAAKKYVAKANDSSASSCGTGTYKAAHTVYYGGTSSCSSCPSGYDDGAAVATQAECIISVAGGKYVGTKNSATLSDCSAGYYKGAHSVAYGSTSSCSACGAVNKYSSSGASACSTVSTGYYTTGGTTTTRTGQSQCTSGTYCTGGEQKTCPSGYGASAAGSDAAADCYMSVAAAKYVKAANDASATACGTGTYKAAHTVYYGGTSSCSSCPSGYDDGAAVATQAECIISVAGGKYVGTKNSATLTDCSAGYYKAAHSVAYGSTSSCSACGAVNKYSSSGASACSTVSTGYYTTGGTTTTRTGQSQCTSGTYCTGGEQKTCPSGYGASAAGSDAAADCYMSVAAAKYVKAANDASATACGTGTYKAAHTVYYGGTSSCSSCPSGYDDGAAASAESGCKISVAGGKYVGTKNSATLSDCASGTYKAAHSVAYGSTSSCGSCPATASGSDSGRDAATDCYVSCSAKSISNGTTTVVNAKEYYSGSAYPACTFNVNCNAKYGASGNKTTSPACTVCATGKYSAGGTAACSSCTNKPSNSSYTSNASSNACSWSCNDGYNKTADNQCGQFCGAGITHLHLGNGVSIPLYSSARTSPAINVKWNDTVCYGSLSSGKATGLNVKVGTTTYHAVN